MMYKAFRDLNLSRLGFGAMRLPTRADGSVDPDGARALIERAYEQGVNYYDTAYRYHGGESERIVGQVLRQYPRESWHIASKLPGHMMRHENGKYEFSGLLAGRPGRTPQQIFEEQLEKCGVEYFDFYLLHNLCETAYGFYTDAQAGVVEYLLGQQKAGRIRHLGFSAHGRAETIEAFLNWKDCFSFAQIQLNYLDWTVQDAKAKYEVLVRHNLPIVVMEPCRGGMLADLRGGGNALLKAARPEDSIASWAFRFLQSLPGVQLVLSGMTTPEQLEDNLKTFSKEEPTDEREKELLRQAVGELVNLVPCTSCRYCTEGCPQNLDIPKLLSMYNETQLDNPFTLNFTLGAMKPEELPAACIGCGACSAICPQGIDIPGYMSKFSAFLKEWQR